MNIDIEGLEEFQNTVVAFVNDAKDYERLKRKIKNQREQLRAKDNTIVNYKKSLQFDEDIMKAHDKQVQKLTGKNHELNDVLNKYKTNNTELFKQGVQLTNENSQLKNRNRVLKKRNRQNISKLIELNHVLNRSAKDECVTIR